MLARSRDGSAERARRSRLFTPDTASSAGSLPSGANGPRATVRQSWRLGILISWPRIQSMSAQSLTLAD
jgi:hypothetical protein